MMRRFFLVLLTVIILTPQAVYPRESKKVTVLPFKVNAQEDLAYLKTEP